MMARQGGCKFRRVLSSGQKVLLAKGLACLFNGKLSRTLQHKRFKISHELFSFDYAKLRMSPRDRTLKTKYCKDLRRGAFN